MPIAKFEDLSLRYLVTDTTEAELPMVVMLHGRGADMHDLADLAPMLADAGAVRFVFANAPRPFVAYPGMTFGWTWFDGWPPERASVAASREVLLKFLGEATTRYKTSKLVVAGFSQGAMMSLDAGLRTDVAGIIAMSGGLYEPDLPDLEQKKGLPVLIAHGIYDDVVPVAYARRARHVLEEAGLDVEYHEYPMQHQVAQEEVEVMRRFVARRLL
jgi:phospholipase/carboxylesterase